MSMHENVFPMVVIPSGLSPIERKAFLRQAQIDTFEPKVDHLSMEAIEAEEKRLDALEDEVVLQAHMANLPEATRAGLTRIADYLRKEER